MPVIVKLSRKVYDHLGDDVVGELVDWLNEMDVASHASIRELNELNFSRFDSKLEQRLTEFRTDLARDLDARLATVATKAELAAAIAPLATRAELTAAIATNKAELLKWMVAMWIATLIAPFLAAALR